MTCVFCFRTPRSVPWSYTTGVFLFPIENAAEQPKYLPAINGEL